MNRYTRLALASAILFASAPAIAQDWWARGGFTHVNPTSDNGVLAGTLALDIDSNAQLGLSFGRHLDDNWAVEVLAATPFSHTASLNGAEAVDFNHLPPTVSVQYYFGERNAAWRPFVGAGVNFTWVYDEESRGPVARTDIDIDNSWGLAAQVGLLWNVNDAWHATFDARWIDIEADVELNGAAIGTATVDPLVLSVMVGTTF
jgi:outer membrane protein